MRISKLAAHEVTLPLKHTLKHASATRSESASIVVRIRLADGTEGWGEGVPRKYVTGETVEGAFEQLHRTPLESQLDLDCSSWDDVIAMCERFSPARATEDPRGAYGNSLRCAVELAVLDAYGRLFREPLSRVTHLFPPAEPIREAHRRVRYSTVLFVEGPRKERLASMLMRLYGFAQCKVKVGAAGTNDAVRLKRIRSWFGEGVDLRVDANEAWRASQLVSKIEPLLDFGITCVEQPVAHEEVESLAEVRRKLSVPIMLDESLTSVRDAHRAIGDNTCDLFNIRLSKCGGFLNSLRLAAIARGAGLRYQLGAHPGESGILSAAGRHWACSVGDIRYLEGSYDAHLFKERLTRENITFGYGGIAPCLSGPGLGVSIRSETLKRFTKRRESWDFG